MGKIRDAIANLRRALEELEPYEDTQAVAPEAGYLYETFNGSVVYVVEVDRDGDGVTLVLKGGHRIGGSNGEKPCERYFVDKQGYFRMSNPGAEMGMSLLRQLPVDIHDYGRPTEEHE